MWVFVRDIKWTEMIIAMNNFFSKVLSFSLPLLTPFPSMLLFASSKGMSQTKWRNWVFSPVLYIHFSRVWGNAPGLFFCFFVHALLCYLAVHWNITTADVRTSFYSLTIVSDVHVRTGPSNHLRFHSNALFASARVFHRSRVSFFMIQESQKVKTTMMSSPVASFCSVCVASSSRSPFFTSLIIRHAHLPNTPNCYPYQVALMSRPLPCHLWPCCVPVRSFHCSFHSFTRPREEWFPWASRDHCFLIKCHPLYSVTFASPLVYTSCASIW